MSSQKMYHVDRTPAPRSARIILSNGAAASGSQLKVDRVNAYFPSDQVRYVDFASPPPRPEIVARISALREIAGDDGVPFSADSCADMHDFLKIRPGAGNPNIFLLDSGNLRIVWKSSDGRQIGLQFCGDKKVQFVLFSRRPGSDVAVRSAGWDTIEGVGKQIISLDLMSLLYQ